MRAWRAAIVLAGAGAYLVLALSWLGRERLRDASTFPAASVYNESAEGCALAYRYLQATRGGPKDVRVLAQPLGWEPPAANAVVLRLRPQAPSFVVQDAEDSEDREPHKKREKSTPAPLLSADDEAWVRGGGRLVIGLDKSWDKVALRQLPRGAAVAKVFPIWLGVARLAPPIVRAFEGDPSLEGHAVFASAQSSLLWRRPLGRGEVLLLSTPEVLENRALGEADHLALLDALAGAQRVVYFDEHVHGLKSESGLFDLLLRWGFGPALVLAGAAFGLLFWRRRAPTGAYEEAPLPRRSEAVDLVDSMALLYGRVLSRSEAVARYAGSFERALALRSGLRGRALAAGVRQRLGEVPSAAPGGKDLHAVELADALARINDAFRRLEEHAHTGRRR